MYSNICKLGLKCREQNSINNLHVEIVVELKTMLDENNVLVKSFRMAKDKMHDEVGSKVKLKLIGRKSGDAITYNLTLVSEVVALVVGDFDESLSERDKVVETQAGVLKHINELNLTYLNWFTIPTSFFFFCMVMMAI